MSGLPAPVAHTEVGLGDRRTFRRVSFAFRSTARRGFCVTGSCAGPVHRTIGDLGSVYVSVRRRVRNDAPFRTRLRRN